MIYGRKGGEEEDSISPPVSHHRHLCGLVCVCKSFCTHGEVKRVLTNPASSPSLADKSTINLLWSRSPSDYSRLSSNIAWRIEEPLSVVICGDATSLPTLEEEEIVREEEEEEERQKSVFVKDALRAAGGVGSLSLLLLLFVRFFFCPPFASVCSGEMEGEGGRVRVRHSGLGSKERGISFDNWVPLFCAAATEGVTQNTILILNPFFASSNLAAASCEE